MKRQRSIYSGMVWKMMLTIVMLTAFCMSMQIRAHAEVKAYETLIIPDYKTRYLTDSEISEMPLQVLCYGKNEIYANHGRKFVSQELQSYFNTKSWYHGTIEPQNFSDSVLNNYELENIRALTEREQELGGYQLDVPGYSYQPVEDYIDIYNESASSQDYYKVRVNEGYLALRDGKSYDSANEKGQLYTGDLVCVKDYSDSTYWYVYSPKHNDYGFVNKNFLEKSTSSGSNKNYKTVKVNSGYLALRSGKSYDSGNEKGQLYTGDVVLVYDSSDSTYWFVYSPKYDDTGYVNKDFLY